MELNIKQISVTIILYLSTLNAYTHPQTQKYIQWENIPSKELDKKYNALCLNKETADSAFIYATIVANRYSPSLKKEEKILCVNANINLWYLCLIHFNDFSKAYNYILKADDIRNELKTEIPAVDMNMGCFYDFLADQNDDKSLKRDALNYYKKAIESSYRLKYKPIFHSTFFNIITLLMDYYEDINDIWELYSNADFAKDDIDFEINTKAYKALQLSHKGMVKESLNLLKEIELKETSEISINRYRYIIECLKANVYEVNGDIKNAIKHINNALSFAYKQDTYEIKVYAYNKICEYYKKINDVQNHQEYKNKYLSLKDSLLGYRQISNISKMKFLNKIDKMDVEIMEMKQNRKIQNIFSIVICIILVIILVSATLLYIKNKQISKKNNTLYRNYKEKCSIEEELRKKIRNEKNQYQTNVSPIKEVKKKYVSSSLSAEDKNEILDKILNVMENTEEICSSNFSTDRLAELVGANYKYISQVINEKYGYSFSHLLNKYRVKEICRRFADTEKYGNYTTEAIAEGVGFKNRTTFINAFKKETGMTPYQYLKLTKREKEEEY